MRIWIITKQIYNSQYHDIASPTLSRMGTIYTPRSASLHVGLGTTRLSEALDDVNAVSHPRYA